MKKRRKSAKWLVALLLVVPATYVGFQMVKIFRRTYTTQTAVPYTMADTVLCDGILGMKEQNVPYSGSGVLGYLAQNGERVSSGTAVAQLFPDAAQAASSILADRLTSELALLEKSQISGATAVDVDALVKQTLNGVYDILDAGQTGNYAGIASARSAIQLAQNKLQISTGAATDFSERIASLKMQRDAARAASSSVPVLAPASGYFVAAQDSTQRLYSMEELQAMAPGELQSAAQRVTPDNDASVAGKLILDYRWRYFASVTAKQAAKFTEGARVQLSFPNVSAQSVPATVVSVTVDDASQLAKVELLCDYINSTIVTLEHEPARVAFKTYTGIRIDQAARHVIDGVDYVYVRSGNVAYLRRVKILFEDENYILVPSTKTAGENEVQLFDEIIVRGTDLANGKVL